MNDENEEGLNQWIADVVAGNTNVKSWGQVAEKVKEVQMEEEAKAKIDLNQVPKKVTRDTKKIKGNITRSSIELMIYTAYMKGVLMGKEEHLESTLHRRGMKYAQDTVNNLFKT